VGRARLGGIPEHRLAVRQVRRLCHERAGRQRLRRAGQPQEHRRHAGVVLRQEGRPRCCGAAPRLRCAFQGPQRNHLLGAPPAGAQPARTGLPQDAGAGAHPLQGGRAVGEQSMGQTVLHPGRGARRQGRPRRGQAGGQAVYIVPRIPARAQTRWRGPGRRGDRRLLAAGHSACATHRSAASRTAVRRSGPASTENGVANRPQSACRTSCPGTRRPSMRPDAGWLAASGPRHMMRLARLISSATAVSVSSPTTLASRRVTPAACCDAQRATSFSRSARSGCTRSAGHRGHVAAAASAGARASTLLTSTAACAVVLAGGLARAHIACLRPIGSNQRGRRL